MLIFTPEIYNKYNLDLPIWPIMKFINSSPEECPIPLTCEGAKVLFVGTCTELINILKEM
jgi:hypothetical protein